MSKKKVKTEKAVILVPKVLGNAGNYAVKFKGGVFIQTELSLAQAKAKVKALEDQDKILKGKNYTAGFYEIV